MVPAQCAKTKLELSIDMVVRRFLATGSSRTQPRLMGSLSIEQKGGVHAHAI